VPDRRRRDLGANVPSLVDRRYLDAAVRHRHGGVARAGKLDGYPTRDLRFAGPPGDLPVMTVIWRAKRR